MASSGCPHHLNVRGVLPFAHVSNNKKYVTLINPQAVDLDAYKKKLQEAIKVYERQLIWRALPQEEKDKFEQNKPVSYIERKESLLQALENAKWPISYEEVMLLEDEILTGLTYEQQAIELKEASKEEPQRICPLQICPAKQVGGISLLIYLRGCGLLFFYNKCTRQLANK
uniref:Uncharacterized protein n=1 Tax=Podarcis muralis TaxID=64176 RepID=A0A670I8D2_PODMU